MFLGINEMKYSKGRYLLIILVMALITWLILVLSGLATGLAQGNRLAVDQWKASGVVLSKEANSNLNASTLNQNLASKIKADQVATIGQVSLSISKEDKTDNDRTNVSLFGIDSSSFLMPKVIAGKSFAKKNEVIATEKLKEDGFKLGDKINAGTYDQPLTIVGWFAQSTYNIVPVIYTSTATVKAIKYGSSEAQRDNINGFVFKGTASNQVKTPNEDTVVLSINDFIEKLPGYQAQNLTLDTMIYFLIAISAFIVGIFIFVLTLQKTSIFGVLKVQGVPTSYLAKAVILQTGLLAVLGVLLGTLLTGLTVAFLPDSMPYTTDYGNGSLYLFILVIMAILGSIFSIRTIAKVDPLTAIGG